MKKYSSIVVGFLALCVSSVYADVAVQPVAALLSQPAPTSSCLNLSYTLTLRSNDMRTNGEVTRLQKFLLNEGFLEAAPSGYFGVVTQKAVRLYQEENRISKTGTVGPATRRAIKARSCASTTGQVFVVTKVADVVPALTAPVQQVQSTTTSQSPSVAPTATFDAQINAKNPMSCSSPTFKALANGQIGCYGIWSTDHVFGDDIDMCPQGGYSPGVGCKVKTIACDAGQAFATRAIKPQLLDIASEDLGIFAKNLHSTPDTVKRQVLMLWEYRCSDYGLSSYGTKK